MSRSHLLLPRGAIRELLLPSHPRNMQSQHAKSAKSESKPHLTIVTCLVPIAVSVSPKVHTPPHHAIRTLPRPTTSNPRTLTTISYHLHHPTIKHLLSLLVSCHNLPTTIVSLTIIEAIFFFSPLNHLPELPLLIATANCRQMAAKLSGLTHPIATANCR